MPNSATVLCREPVPTDEHTFDPPQRIELESAGAMTRSSQLRTAQSNVSTLHQLSCSLPSSRVEGRLSFCKLLFLSERVIREVESIAGAHQISTPSAVGDMEFTIAQLNQDVEHTTKSDIQNLETKIEILARTCRQQKLISLPLECVRAAGNNLQLFGTVNVVLRQLHETIMCLRSISGSNLAHGVLNLNASEASKLFSESLRLQSELESAEALTDATEERIGKFQLSLKEKMNFTIVEGL